MLTSARLAAGLVAAVLALSAALVAAQGAATAYPAKPVRVIVPFPPGGSTDVMGRRLAQELTKSLGQPFVVENRSGMNGSIGSDAVAKAAPDGYTLLVAGVGTNAINQALYPNHPYETVRDFAPIVLFAEGPNVVVVNPGFPAKTLPELVAMAKAKPGHYAFASNGNGSSGRLAMEMIEQATGIDLVHIPYRGGGPAMQDVLGGQVPIYVTNQDAALPHVKASKLRALAVTSAQRNPAYPDVPTVAESGVPGFSAVSWFGLAAPAKTPRDIVDKLNAEVAKVLGRPEFRKQLEEQGFVVAAGTPEEFGAFMKNEVDKWGKAVKASGATID